MLQEYTFVEPAEHATRDPDASIFDAKALLERLMGDRRLAGIVLKGFLQDIPRQLETLRARVGDRDFDGIRLQVHTLKGAAATVAATRLHAVAVEMELPGTIPQLDLCGELLPLAVEAFEQFKNTLVRTGWVSAS